VAVADIYVLDFVINIGMCVGSGQEDNFNDLQLSLLVGRLSWTRCLLRSSNWARRGVRTIFVS